MAASTSLNNSGIITIVAVIVLVFSSIVMFSRANKFDVKGKVRMQPLNQHSLV
jgi:cell division protein FtsL